MCWGTIWNIGCYKDYELPMEVDVDKLCGYHISANFKVDHMQLLKQSSDARNIICLVEKSILI